MAAFGQFGLYGHTVDVLNKVSIVPRMTPAYLEDSFTDRTRVRYRSLEEALVVRVQTPRVPTLTRTATRVGGDSACGTGHSARASGAPGTGRGGAGRRRRGAAATPSTGRAAAARTARSRLIAEPSSRVR